MSSEVKWCENDRKWGEAIKRWRKITRKAGYRWPHADFTIRRIIILISSKIIQGCLCDQGLSVIPAQSGCFNFSMCPLKYWEADIEYLTISCIQKLRTSRIQISDFYSPIISTFSNKCFIFLSIRFIEALQSFSEPSIFVYSFNFS